MKVNHSAKGDGVTLLCSLLRGAGSCNSSISNLDEFESMKEDTKSDGSFDLSIAMFSAAKELVKTTKEAGLGDNP